MVDILNDENFDEKVSKGIVLVDFYAEWCGPCRMIAPIVEKMANEINDVSFVKVNVEDSPLTSAKFQITSIPTFIVFKDGVAMSKNVGAQPQKEFFTGLIDLAR